MKMQCTKKEWVKLEKIFSRDYLAIISAVQDMFACTLLDENREIVIEIEGTFEE